MSEHLRREEREENAAIASESFARIQKLEAKVAELEHNMFFLLELGIEKHLADHNRELHAREMSLDFKNDAGLSRAGLE